MIRFLTAGESHGKALTTIIEGFPSNLFISKEYIDKHLKRRQKGYGRGARMLIESDEVEILSGVRFSKTLGSPISLLIKNKDWENWKEALDTEGKGEEIEKIFIPRPGHADLNGVLKYNFNDVRNSIERSSARETAARVAACSVARRFLEEFGITVGSFVESIGGVYDEESFFEKLINHDLPKDFNAWDISVQADKSNVRVLSYAHQERIVSLIRDIKKKGDTLGGTFIVVATGVPPGLGSFIQFDKKINAEILGAIASINAVKGASIGDAFNISGKPGSEVHDEIIFSENSFKRKTNRAGGVEGGITTGMPLIVKAAMKPISTLMNPLKSINLADLKEVDSRFERSDFTAVSACAVVGESMLAWVIAKYLIEKFGGDSMEETLANFKHYTGNIYNNIVRNFNRVESPQ
jgi:chorismate synthase